QARGRRATCTAARAVVARAPHGVLRWLMHIGHAVRGRLALGDGRRARESGFRPSGRGRQLDGRGPGIFLDEPFAANYVLSIGWDGQAVFTLDSTVGRVIAACSVTIEANGFGDAHCVDTSGPTAGAESEVEPRPELPESALFLWRRASPDSY